MSFGITRTDLSLRPSSTSIRIHPWFAITPAEAMAKSPAFFYVHTVQGRKALASDCRCLGSDMKVVLNQVFRTLLHSRLKLGLQRYVADDRFEGDIVLLEPRESDANIFSTNPLAFWRRSESLRHGFESVRLTIEQNFEQLQEVFGRYGLEMDREVAQTRAAHTRIENNWQPAEPEPAEEFDEPALRLVGNEPA